MKTETQTALNAFLKAHAEVLGKLATLQNLADDHFGVDPDRVSWSQVADMARINEALDELIEIAND